MNIVGSKKRTVLILAMALFFASRGFADGLVHQVSTGKEIVHLTKNKKLNLAALHNDVTFEFATLPDTMHHYAFILKGFDQGWFKARFPVARYTNLSGGDYDFIIRLMRGNQVVRTERLPVFVEKELREEAWFIPAVIVYVVLLISAGIYFFLLYNFRQKLKLQSMRYKIASDLHDEVGATLSSIAISTRLVQNKMGNLHADVQPILDRIKSDSEETISTIRDTVWAINPDNDSPEKLFEKMRSFGYQLLSALDIAFEFNNSILPGTKMNLSMEQRRNIFLIFKEAVNNIAKHSGASKASVALTQTSDGIRMVIEDNGRGFNVQSEFEGNGLKSFRHRASDSFMDFQLFSIPGTGTRMEVGIPEM